VGTAGLGRRVVAGGLAVLVLFAGPQVVLGQALDVRPLYQATRDALIVRQAEGIVRRAVLRRAAIRFGLRFAGWVGLAVLAYELAEEAYRQLREAQRVVQPGYRKWLWNGEEFREDYVGPVGTRCRIVDPYPSGSGYLTRLNGWSAGYYVYGGGRTPGDAQADLWRRIAQAVAAGDWPARCWGPDNVPAPQPVEVPEQVRYPWPGTSPGPDPSQDMPESVERAAERPEWVSTGVEQAVVGRIADRMAEALSSHPDSMSLQDALQTGVSWEPTPTAEQLAGPGSSEPPTRGEQEAQTGLLQEILRKLGELVDAVRDLPEKIAQRLEQALERMLKPRPEVMEQLATRVQRAIERKAPWGLVTEAKRLADQIGGVGGGGCDWRVGTYTYQSAQVSIDPSPVICPVAGLVRSTVLVVVIVGFVWWAYATFAPRFGL
jgi:hypothetical protein